MKKLTNFKEIIKPSIRVIHLSNLISHRGVKLIVELKELKKENQYITFTLHNGRDFNLYEKSLENWVKNDDPLNKKIK